MPSPAPKLTRFWKNVTLEEVNGAYQIQLDKRSIKTPDGRKVAIPLEQRALGLLMVGEWDSQTQALKPHSLPLTSLVARSIDGLQDPKMRKDVIAHLTRYLHTDAICLHQDHPQALINLQLKHWRPVTEWIEKEYQVRIHTTDQLFNMSQSPETEAKLVAAVTEFSPLKLAAFERAVMHSKSFLLALALVNRQVSVDDAVLAAHVEVLSQIQQWGLVEDSK
ncbi:chaperone [Tieghemiomyces parasiticus]|uniref:Chaperone n=1 Tax=Tieghemiomyces parasiticus TaxID=78921 RepID=A0A9W7ZUH4_9FUNG|nr:chaperone [Tieghemiomyces parasiticus]